MSDVTLEQIAAEAAPDETFSSELCAVLANEIIALRRMVLDKHREDIRMDDKVYARLAALEDGRADLTDMACLDPLPHAPHGWTTQPRRGLLINVRCPGVEDGRADGEQKTSRTEWFKAYNEWLRAGAPGVDVNHSPSLDVLREQYGTQLGHENERLRKRAEAAERDNAQLERIHHAVVQERDQLAERLTRAEEHVANVTADAERRLADAYAEQTRLANIAKELVGGLARAEKTAEEACKAKVGLKRERDAAREALRKILAHSQEYSRVHIIAQLALDGEW